MSIHSFFQQDTRVVTSNVAQSPSSGLLHAGIKFLEALNEGLQGAAIHHRLRQLRRVLGDGAQDKGGRLLVETLFHGGHVRTAEESRENSFECETSE